MMDNLRHSLFSGLQGAQILAITAILLLLAVPTTLPHLNGNAVLKLVEQFNTTNTTQLNTTEFLHSLTKFNVCDITPSETNSSKFLQMQQMLQVSQVQLQQLIQVRCGVLESNISQSTQPETTTVNILESTQPDTLLDRLLAYIYEKATVIMLNNTRLVTLYPNQFSQFTQLRQLYLDQASLIEIHDDAFKGTYITMLNLSYNALLQVPNLSVLNKTLEILILRNNSILNISSQLIGLSRLQHADLSKNKISSVSNFSFCGTTIRRLELSYNRLSVFPNLTCIKETLVSLTLSGNWITDISKQDFEGMQALQSIKMYSNHISDIESGAFENIRSLKSLNLKKNSFQLIEADMFVNTSLEAVDFDMTNLLSFPDFYPVQSTMKYITMMKLKTGLSDFTDMNFQPSYYSSLRTLRLSLAKGAVVPSQRIRPTSLHDLHITCNGGCNFTDIGTLIATNQELRKLRLESMGLTKLPNFTQVSANNKITLINMNGNILKEIMPHDIFGNLVSLTNLTLSNNNLTSFPASVLSVIGKKLILLNLKNNAQLGDLDIYDSLHTIRVLYLQNTSTTQFPNLTSVASTIREVYLDNNPLRIMNKESLSGLYNLRNLSLINSLRYIVSVPDLSYLWINHSLLSLKLSEIACYCDNTWIIDRVQNDESLHTAITMTTSQPCVAPQRLKHRGLSNLKPMALCIDYDFNAIHRGSRSKLDCLMNCTNNYNQCSGYHHHAQQHSCSIYGKQLSLSSGSLRPPNSRLKSVLCHERTDINIQGLKDQEVYTCSIM